MIHEVNGWEEDDEYWEDPEAPDDREDEWDDREDEWVLDCGNEWCCMPGYHFRYECHRGGER